MQTCTGYLDGCECRKCLDNEARLKTCDLNSQPYERLDQGDKRWMPVRRLTIEWVFSYNTNSLDEIYQRLDSGEEIQTVWSRYRKRLSPF